MCAGLDLKSLPQTFRDAILVTRKFGLHYLWIDCLCIIQDSKEDWFHEAALMGEVYKNSYLNIAATGAVDSNGGLFFDRNPALIRPSRIQIDWAGRSGLSLHSYYLIDSIPSLKNRLDEARLNRRAWVVQERLLAPRVLHFTRTQLFWECRELEACESYPNGLPKTHLIKRRQLKSALFGHGPDTMEQQKLYSSESPTLFQHWAWVVDFYTRARLTVVADRPTALLGIVTEMQRLLEDEYLCGLWRRSLRHELLWIVNDRPSENDMLPFRPQTYRAPSWSWMSVEGSVSYEHCLESLSKPVVVEMASIVSAQVYHDLHNHNQVHNGFVTIRGKLGLTTWVPDQDIYSSGIIVTQFTYVRPLEPSVTDDPPPSSQSRNDVYPSSTIKFDTFNKSHPPPPTLFVLPIVAVDDPLSWVQDYEIVHGLLLTPDREEEGMFRRVGRFFVSEEKASEGFRALIERTVTIV